MSNELAGKVAIVTGGAGGIGRGIVECFVEEGAQVVIADVDAERGEELATELGDAAAFKQTDVADADQVQAAVDFAVERFGGLHVMCNNAGIGGRRRRFLDDDLDDFDALMRVNVFGVMVGCQRAGRHMARARRRLDRQHHVDRRDQRRRRPDDLPRAKAAVIHLTRCVAVDARRTRHPRRTASRRPTSPPTSTRPTTRRAIVRLMQPLQRIGSPRGRRQRRAVPRERPVGAGHRDRAAGRRRHDRRAGPMVKFEDVAARPDAKAR